MVRDRRSRIRSLPRPPLAVAALSIAAGLIWIPQAFLLAGVVGDVVTAPENAAIVAPLLGVIALAVVRAGADGLAQTLAQGFASRTREALRRDIALRAAAWSPVDAGRPAAGEIAALATDQMEALEPYLVRYHPARLRMTVLPAAIALAVLPVSWAAAVLLVAAAPFIPLFMSLIGAQARDRSIRQLAEIGTFTGILLDRLSGLGTIRLFRAEDRTAARIADAGDDIRRRTMSVLRLAFLSSAVLELFSAISVALVAVYVGFSLLGWITFGTWGAPLTLSGGLFVLLLAPDFFQPFRDFAAAYHDKASADALAERLATVVDAPRAEVLSGGGGAPIVGEGAQAPAVRVAGLTVKAPGSGVVLLDEISFAVPPGGRLAIAGPSGAGKSTLIAAIAGLVPFQGEVRIGGTPLDAATADGLRAGMAFVGQHPFLLARSLHANLAFHGAGDPAALSAAVTAVRLDRLVERLPRGLATPLGEQGFGLSGGEARRLALARAMVAGRGLLIADEPTADLDEATAEAVRVALLAAAEGRTLIVATHDPVLIARIGRTVRIRDGRMADAGGAR